MRWNSENMVCPVGLIDLRAFSSFRVGPFPLCSIPLARSLFTFTFLRLRIFDRRCQGQSARARNLFMDGSFTDKEGAMMEREGPTRATRFGLWLGRRWCGYLRCEEKAFSYLQRKGLSLKISKILGWIVKASVLIALLYVAFWITLIVLAIAVAGYRGFISDTTMDIQSPELRDGLSGFGLYDQGGARIDPHDPDEIP